MFEKLLDNLKVIQNAKDRGIDVTEIKYEYRHNLLILKETYNLCNMEKSVNVLLSDKRLIEAINQSGYDILDVKFLLEYPYDKLYSVDELEIEMDYLLDTIKISDSNIYLRMMRESIGYDIYCKKRTVYICDLINYLHHNNIECSPQKIKYFLQIYIMMNEIKSINDMLKDRSYSKEDLLKIATSNFIYKKCEFTANEKYPTFLEEFDYKENEENVISEDDKFIEVKMLYSLLKRIKIDDIADLNEFSIICHYTSTINLIEELYFSIKNNTKTLDDVAVYIHVINSVNFKYNIFEYFLYKISRIANVLTVGEMCYFSKNFTRRMKFTQQELTELEVKIDKYSKIDYFKKIFGENSLLVMAIKNKLPKTHVEFIKRLIKGKNLVKVIEQSFDIFSKLPEDNILFDERFQSIVNIYNLNSKNISQLLQSGDIKSSHYINKEQYDNMELLDENKPLTFNEFWYLIRTNRYNVELFYKLYEKGYSIDQRLSLMRQFPTMPERFTKHYVTKCCTIINKQNYYDNVSEIDFINAIMKYAIEGGFKKKVQKLKAEYPNIKNIDDLASVIILINYNRPTFVKYLREVKERNDIYTIAMYLDEMRDNNLSIEECREKRLYDSLECNYLIDSLSLTKEFVSNHIYEIINFCDNRLIEVYKTLISSEYQGDIQKSNLKKITTAYLANKLEEFKFVKSDFNLEIGMKICERQIDEWKKNEKIVLSRFEITETYDYNDVIRLGENPVETCQHWNGGNQSKSLLSNFDTNKKLLVCKLDNKINTRSVIRLTKGYCAKNNTTSMNELRFKELDELETHTDEEIKEELVLFVGKPYSNLDEKDLKLALREMVTLAKEKANKLNARLVLYKSYHEVVPEYDVVDYNIFVSYSKNHVQYIDSLGGELDNDKEGQYINTKVVIVK